MSKNPCNTNGLPGIETIKASEFKAKCLHLMERVADGEVEYLITKNGTPKARLVPCKPPQNPSAHGKGRGNIQVLGDIVSPAFDGVWDAELGKMLPTDQPMQDDDSA